MRRVLSGPPLHGTYHERASLPLGPQDHARMSADVSAPQIIAVLTDGLELEPAVNALWLEGSRAAATSDASTPSCGIRSIMCAALLPTS